MVGEYVVVEDPLGVLGEMVVVQACEVCYLDGFNERSRWRGEE